MDLREQIEELIISFVSDYQKRDNIHTRFGQPIVGVADAFAPEIQNLKQVIGFSHALPQDVLPDAKSVIAYYVPFTEELALTNSHAGTASPQWARAYEELNFLFSQLNRELVDFIKGLGNDPQLRGDLAADAGLPGVGADDSTVLPAGDLAAAIPKAASEFDQIELVSNWSHRHMAYAAGLGTFGINNMLITKLGCCGRFSSIVTNIDSDILPFDSPMEQEMCSYKQDGSCGVCIANCPGLALHPESHDKFGAGFSRARCYDVCLENAALYPFPEDLAPSYVVPGSEVCGKCVTGSPCAFLDPKKICCD